MKLTKRILSLTVFCIIILTVPLNTFGKMYVETFIASGRIVSIDNNIITLDNGFSYLPLQQDMTITASEGQMVTIRYVINNEAEKKYSEVGIGMNSLKNAPPPIDIIQPDTKY